MLSPALKNKGRGCLFLGASFFTCLINAKDLHFNTSSTREIEKAISDSPDVWTYSTAKEYVERTSDFNVPPCIIPREVWDKKWPERKAILDAKVKSYNESISKIPTNLSEEDRADRIQELEQSLVRPSELSDYTSMTIHQTLSGMNSGPDEILSGHLMKRYSDVAYNFLVMKKPKEGEFNFNFIQGVLKSVEEFKLKNKDDKRVSHCSQDKKAFVFELRPLEYTSAHVQGMHVKRNPTTGFYELRTSKGKLINLQTNQKHDDEIFRYKLSEDKEWLVQVDQRGDPVLDKSGYSQMISLHNSKDTFHEFELGNQWINLSRGNIGIALSGSFSSKGCAKGESCSQFCFSANASECTKQPPVEMVEALGQLVTYLKMNPSHPNLVFLRGHGSGCTAERVHPFPKECPGEGAMEILNALRSRFDFNRSFLRE